MNSYFSTGDWVIIVVYLLGIIGLGVWFGKDQATTRDYFLGSRNVPWWGIGLSIVAAETSALTIIGVPGMAYGSDVALVQMIIGYVIARIILAIVLVPHYFYGEIYSPYELFARTFGPSARQTAGAFFLISETLAAGVRVYVASIPVKLLLGDRLLGVGTGNPILVVILLFVLLSILYAYIGGVGVVSCIDAAHVSTGLYPDTRGRRPARYRGQSNSGRKAALAKRDAAIGSTVEQVRGWSAFQHLDGHHRGHGDGDVVPRR
jgi:Na+/proline symporter